MGTPRAVMYAMIGLCQMCNYVVRQALPSLIPLIAAAAGYSAAERALLLASFFPGYLATQVRPQRKLYRVGPKCGPASGL
jgi:hypothetical protein